MQDIIEKKGGIRMQNITGHFSQAAEGVRNTIGWTKPELEDFLKKNAAMFAVSEDEVRGACAARARGSGGGCSCGRFGCNAHG